VIKYLRITLANQNYTYKKGNVKLFLCLIKYHTMKMDGGVEVQLHAFLTLALDGGE
jgi:hypothetical protein